MSRYYINQYHKSKYEKAVTSVCSVGRIPIEFLATIEFHKRVMNPNLFTLVMNELKRS